jgi:hypothetical protein
MDRNRRDQMIEEPDRLSVRSILLHNDDVFLDAVLMTAARCGMNSLEMFQAIYTAKFELLGINAAMLHYGRDYKVAPGEPMTLGTVGKGRLGGKILPMGARLGAACIFIYSTQALSQKWDGHTARLDAAKIACRDIYSAACEPFLAEAVGIVDYVHSEAPERNCDRLNGLEVARLALALDDKTFFYWSQAVIAATRSICKLP